MATKSLRHKEKIKEFLIADFTDSRRFSKEKIFNARGAKGARDASGLKIFLFDGFIIGTYDTGKKGKTFG